MSPVPDYTEGLPALLSARSKAAEAGARGVLFDVTIGGLGFILAPDSQNPYVRETVDVQKQQIDTSAEPGEQTFDGLWVRSQTSWHLGAGADFYEPAARNDLVPTAHRFRDSSGVDVWTEGSLSLLRRMDSVDDTSSGSAKVVGAYDSTDGDVWFSYFGSTLRRHKTDGTSTDYAAASNTPDVRICAAGSVILLGGAFGVYSAPVSGGAPAALWTQALGTVAVPYWVKSRVGITRGASLYFGSLVGGDLDAATAHWTHPDTSWQWTGMAETPDAIIAAGHNGGLSAVFALTLSEDTSGSVPKLSQPFQVAELPPGELILSVKSYLGKYLGIGTNKGIRIAVIGSGGQIQYGPLLETADPVTDLDARDSFMYAAAGSRVIRVNLAASIDSGLRYPYANDVEVGGTISSLSFIGTTDRVVVSCDTDFTYAQSATEYVDSGWIESGQIRYGTSSPKAFRVVDVVATTEAATSVAVQSVVGDTTTGLVTLSSGLSGLGISLASLPSPLASAGYRLVMSTTDTTKTPVVDVVAVKAAPTPRRQLRVRYPLILSDDLRDSRGNAYGYAGAATEILAAIEQLAGSGTVVTVMDSTRPEQFDASIEKVQVVRVKGRAGNGDGNFGGVLNVTVQTL